MTPEEIFVVTPVETLDELKDRIYKRLEMVADDTQWNAGGHAAFEWVILQIDGMENIPPE